MRVVLRVEVEAVKFLKEEPHRLDALLKRCKTITDTLNAMRKYEPSPSQSYSASGLIILSFAPQKNQYWDKMYLFISYPLKSSHILILCK